MAAVSIVRRAQGRSRANQILRPAVEALDTRRCAWAAGSRHACRCSGALLIGMDILYMLIPLSLVLALLIGASFWWATKSGQFDDLEGPAHRILADDDDPC